MIQNELSPSERMILDYIKFKTNNKVVFFASNQHIATYIGIKPSSTKVLINGLIRKGYLIRGTDGKHVRTLSLSGKEYLPMAGCNMADLDKGGLKKERDTYKDEYERLTKWVDELQAENNLLKQKCATLEQNLNNLNTQLEKEFIPDYQAKIARVAELEKMLKQL